MSKWQPIETAPRDGTVVDLWYRGERITDYRWVQISKTNGFFECAESGYTCVRDATNWMSIPEPPNE